MLLIFLKVFICNYSQLTCTANFLVFIGILYWGNPTWRCCQENRLRCLSPSYLNSPHWWYQTWHHFPSGEKFSSRHLTQIQSCCLSHSAFACRHSNTGYQLRDKHTNKRKKEGFRIKGIDGICQWSAKWSVWPLSRQRVSKSLEVSERAWGGMLPQLVLWDRGRWDYRTQTIQRECGIIFDTKHIILFMYSTIYELQYISLLLDFSGPVRWLMEGLYDDTSIPNAFSYDH